MKRKEEKNFTLDEFIEEAQRLLEVEELLEQVLMECTGYGCFIQGMTPETHRRVRQFMEFDDSE